MANNRKLHPFDWKLKRKDASSDTLPISTKPYASSSQPFHSSKNNKRKHDGNSDSRSSNRPTKKARYQKITFSGNYADQYQQLYDYTKRHHSNEQGFNELGGFSSGKMLFRQHPETKKMATTFLNKFWQDATNRQSAIDTQHWKYKHLGKGEPLSSKCISFISLNLDNQKYCLVATSHASAIGYNGAGAGAQPNSERVDLNARLAVCAKQLNQQDNSELTGVKYLFIIEGFQENYMNLLSGISDQFPKYKSCSEKTLGIALVKLFHEYGKRMYITGQVNCSLYPYEAKKNYGTHPRSVDRTIFEPTENVNSILPLSNNLLTDRRACCDNCLTYKKAMFQVWHAAQTLGEQNQNMAQKQQEENDILMSPLHHSITKEFSSLLPQMSFFTQSTDTAPQTAILSTNYFFSASTSAANTVENAKSYSVSDCPSAPRTPEFKEFYYEDGSKIVVTEEYEIVESILNNVESNLQPKEPSLEYYDCISPPRTPEDKEFSYEEISNIVVSEDGEIVESILIETTESNQHDLEYYDCVSPPRSTEVKESSYEEISKIVVSDDDEIGASILMNTSELNKQPKENYLEYYNCVSPPRTSKNADILDQDNDTVAKKTMTANLRYKS